MYAIGLNPVGTVPSPAFTVSGFNADTLYATFSVENLGNAVDSVMMSSIVIAPSTIAVAQVIFFSDINSNLRFDPGEDDPSFLSLAIAEIVPVDVAIVLSPAGSGDSYLQIQATSANDPLAPAGISVMLAQTVGPGVTSLHLGPYQNAMATPGGEGTPDDETAIGAGYTDVSAIFENDIHNSGIILDMVEVEVADTTGWPPGMTVTIRDTTGAPLPPSPTNAQAYVVGNVAAGETVTLRTEVNTGGPPFYNLLTDSLTLRLRARSLVDTSRTNDTRDHVVPPSRVNTASVLSLQQMFRQRIAAFGDVVTLTVTVSNVSDSVTATSATVTEMPQPSLNFLSSPQFTQGPNGIQWQVGPVGPGETREAVVKFVVNSRMSKGDALVVGSLAGVAVTGEPLLATPITNALRVDNDVFSDEGFVMGEVYLDANENFRREEDERGIKGVAIYLESGEYALTDSLGKYSIPRAFPGFRIVRMDETTLPPGMYVPTDPNDRDALGSEYERMVRVLPTGHANVSFPVAALPGADGTVPRQVSAQELVSVWKQARTFYQLPPLASTNFEPGFAFLKTTSHPSLDPVAEFLNRHIDWMILIEGHTDSIPMNTEAFPSNDALSLARANVLFKYLTAQGVSEHRIITRGYADTRPVATNATAAGRALNRRVEMALIPPGLDFEDGMSVDRVLAEVGDVAEQPDSFQVTIVWDIATDSPAPMNAFLSLDIPEAFKNVKVSVKQGEAEVPVAEDTYTVGEFVRSKGIHCTLSFVTVAADTHLINDLVASVRIGENPSTGAQVRTTSGPSSERSVTTSGSVDFGATAELRPRSTGEGTRTFALHEWREAPLPAPGDELSLGITGAAPLAEKTEGIVWPPDGFIYSKRDKIEVTVKAPLGAKTQLFANGEPVPEASIGQRTIRVKDRVEEISYYGVVIETGWNSIAVATTPVRGDVIRDTVSVALAGRPTSLTAERTRVLVPGNGLATDVVRISVRDDMDLPATDGLVATIVEGDSIVANADTRPDRRGLQVVSRDGYFTLDIAPRRGTGKQQVTIDYNGITSSFIVAYVPHERPAFVTGIVEARLGAFDTKGSSSSLGVDDFHDGLKLTGETRFFVQGTTYAGLNLTARIDSKKRYDDPLLNRLDPERQYAAYGDASELYFAAPAQGGNYVALEKGESYVRYGDFRTPLTRGEFLMYKRASTGVTAQVASERSAARGFVTQTDYRVAQDEIPGDGTSGFYYLTQLPVVEYSENIVLQVRHRFALEQILEIRPLVANRDYTINYFNGAILFKEPIPVNTPEFNPITIVVNYEVRTFGDGDYLYGLRADARTPEHFKLGGSAVANGGEDISYALFGVDGGATLGPFGLYGEVARSEDDIEGAGNAYKVEGYVKNRHVDGSVYFRNVDDNFVNPSFAGNATEIGTHKLGYDVQVNVTRDLALESDAYRHRFDITGEKQDNVEVMAKYNRPYVNFAAGMRHAAEEIQSVEKDGLLSIVAAGIRSPGLFEFKTLWEKNHGDQVVRDYPDLLRSALSAPLMRNTRLTLTHEYRTAGDRPSTNQLLAGVESKLTPTATAYTKYSLNSTASDERAGAISGLKQKLHLKPGLMGTANVEFFRSFSSELESEYLAIQTGLNWVRPKTSMVESKYEYRWQRSLSRHLILLNAMRQFDSGLSFYFQERLSLAYPRMDDTAIASDGRLGGAYRAPGSKLKTIFMLRSLYDRFSPVDPTSITWRLVFSTDLNYALTPKHELRTKLAAKRMEDWSTGLDIDVNSYLVLSQYIYRFADDWDIDLWGRYITQSGVGSDQFGAGLELGRTFVSRIRVAVGYSLNGFEERDMTQTEAWADGVGLRVQFILSDWLFDDLGIGKD